MPYEITIQNQAPGKGDQFEREVVEKLPRRGRRDIAKGDTATREITVEETWQVIGIREVEEAEAVEEPVALDGLSEQEQPQ